MTGRYVGNAAFVGSFDDNTLQGEKEPRTLFYYWF